MTWMRGDERRFGKAIEKKLLKGLGGRYAVESGKNLLYRLQIGPTGQVHPTEEEQRDPKRGRFYAFQTDILVKKANPPTPLVVVELKFGGFSTHDVITYSAKATRHKEIYPYLRYGFVLGGRKPLTNKFFTHNQGFDFAMFVLHLRTDGEKLVRMIRRQISHAETLIDVMRNDRATFKGYERNIDVSRQ
jgi:hypothetical protein